VSRFGNFIFRKGVVTSALALRGLVADAADLLVHRLGFTRDGRMFLRKDELVRGVFFRPGIQGRFGIEFRLGIADISETSPGVERWVMLCSASQLRPDDVPAVAWLRLTKGAYDAEVRKASAAVCTRVAKEFLVKHETRHELYHWVHSSALQLLKDPRAENEYRRLKLDPHNLTRLLELAAVFAAYLGLSSDAGMLTQVATEYAAEHGVDYVIPGIITNVVAAGKRHGT
jgi:hypothetical protein